MSPTRLLRIAGVVLAGAFLIGALNCASCQRRHPKPPVYPLVTTISLGETAQRVLLAETRLPVLLTLEEGATVQPLDGAAPAETLPALDGAGLSPVPNGILIGDRPYPYARLRITPAEGESFTVGEVSYRGTLLLMRKDADLLLVINEIGLEEYLAGVVGAELPSRWPMETLKAQAIAARTYALYKSRQRAGGAFTLYADTRDQMYRGLASESGRPKEAVDSTRGVIATFGGRLFPTFYFSTCGGGTEPADRVFGLPAIRPLSGVRCESCRESKYYRWQAEVAAGRVRSALEQAGYRIGDVQAIEPLPAGSGGAYDRMRVTRTDGTQASMPADVFRSALGPSVVRSTKFSAHRSGENLVFEGRGWGHLVGMCQWGARSMGDEGYGADEILMHYYPAVALVKVY